VSGVALALAIAVRRLPIGWLGRKFLGAQSNHERQLRVHYLPGKLKWQIVSLAFRQRPSVGCC
jgi:hypothetical protein